MRVLAHTANFNGFDEVVPPVAQVGVDMDYRLFNERELPSRKCALSPRLQARIPKMFGWDLAPGYDAYLWHDASLQLSQPDSVGWFLGHLTNADIVVFKHPWRTSAREEADFIQAKLDAGSHYIHVRYAGEDLVGQMRALEQHDGYIDDKLYASGAFCYRNIPAVRAAMKEWWYHTSRFHCVDQLGFPFALWVSGLRVQVVDEDIYHASHLAWMRRRRHG